MKKMVLLMAVALFACMFSYGEAKKDEFKAPKPDDVVFVGVNDVSISIDGAGYLILTATVEYCNRGISDIIVANLRGKVLLIDKEINSDELFSMVYSDFWAQDGKEIIAALKKYECGDYVPEMTGIRKSVKFEKCSHDASGSNYENKTAEFKFNIGKLIYSEPAKNPPAAGATDTKEVVSLTIDRLIKITNTMNDKYRKQAKLVFVVDGLANATKVDATGHASTSVELGNMRMVTVQDRLPERSIFVNKAVANGVIPVNEK